jgi:hypothetical protein
MGVVLVSWYVTWRDLPRRKTIFLKRWIINTDDLWLPYREKDHLLLWSEGNDTNQDSSCICLDCPCSDVVYSKILFILQNIRFLTWDKLLQPCL